jgi:DNA-binding CsgD family transcriptional regulator
MAEAAGSYQQTVGGAASGKSLDRPNRIADVESEGIDRLKRRLRDHHGGIHATPRESETLALLMIGLSDKQVATSLRISPRTVQMHVRNFCHRNRIHNRVEAAALWTIAHAAVASPGVSQ